MSKHKSEVLTVKIQLEVKFLQAVITKIRALPPVFPKMFRTEKLGTAASEIMYENPLICAIGK